MTCRQLYLEARRRLSQAGIDSPGVDAVLLSQRFLGLDRPGLALHGEEEPAPEPAPPEPSAEEKLLTEIRDLLKEAHDVQGKT